MIVAVVFFLIVIGLLVTNKPVKWDSRTGFVRGRGQPLPPGELVKYLRIKAVQSRRTGYVWLVDEVRPDGTLRVHGKTEPDERRIITPGELDSFFRVVKP